jgi:hypothetical protein
LLAEPIDYPGRLEQVVLSPREVSVADGARWLASDPTTLNRKVGHLLNALGQIPVSGRCVISVDADVQVTPELLRSLAMPTLEGAALCSAAPLPLPGPGLAASAARALLLNTHHNFLCLDRMRAGAPTLCGKAMALGPPALALLPELSDRVGEDLELASLLHAAHHPVVLATATARTPQRAAAPMAVLDRFTRWMSVLRAHRPLLFPAIPLLFAPALPLFALALVASDRLAWAAVGMAFAGRAALSQRLHQRMDPPGTWRDAFAWVLGEALLLTALARSIASRTVTWRGHRFELLPGGTLRRAASGPME